MKKLILAFTLFTLAAPAAEWCAQFPVDTCGEYPRCEWNADSHSCRRKDCAQFTDADSCYRAACNWYDASHIPFGGGEKTCYDPQT